MKLISYLTRFLSLYVCVSILFAANVAAEDLIVSGGTVTIDTISVYDSVVVGAAGILIADAPITVTGNMFVQSGGLVRHSDRVLSGLVLDVIGVLEVQSGGAINVDGRGLNAGGSGSIFGTSGETFDSTGAIVSGASFVASSSSPSGGGYGGFGSYGSSSSQLNDLYGLLESPVYLGSGGSKNPVYNTAGGDGGGRITIHASSLVIEGTISADGGDISDERSGCGSGGSILIESGNISGSGTIGANGGSGSGSHSVGGGGGRVAVYFGSMSVPVANFMARGGTHSSSVTRGGAGTVYLKDSAAATGEVIVSNHASSFYRCQRGSHLLTEESSFRRVLVQNGGWLRNDSAFVTDTLWVDQGMFDVVSDYEMGASPLLVTLGSEVDIKDSSVLMISSFDDEWIQSGIVDVQTGSRLDVATDSIVIAGDVTLALRDSSAITGDSTLTQARVAGVFQVDIPLTIVNDLSVESGGSVTHTDRHLDGLDLTVLGVLEVQSGGAINVDGRGLNGGGSGSIFGASGETFDSTGAIVSGASYVASNFPSGGGYGGFGSYGSSSSQLNDLYGLLESPVYLGSGGSKNPVYNTAGGDGGGRITIHASSLVIEGAISADGGDISDERSGCGSGGSILIESGNISGSGTIGANGGSGSGSHSRSGGGGRVAVYFGSMSVPVANIMARGGTHSSSVTRGGAGTVYLKDSAATAGRAIVGNGGSTMFLATPLLTDLVSFEKLSVLDEGILHMGIAGVTIDTIVADAGTLELVVDIAQHTAPMMLNSGSIIVMDSSVLPVTTIDETLAQSGTLYIQAGSRLDVLSDAIVVNDGVSLIKDGMFGALDEIGDLTVLSGGTVSHTSHFEPGLNLIVTGTLDIQSGGSINVSDKGLSGGSSGSVFDLDGETFDSTGAIVSGAEGSTSSTPSGGSYGGFGASPRVNWPQYEPNPDILYGSLEWPLFLGSGGGAGNNGSNPGRDGGGRVTISTPHLDLNGSITANSSNSNNSGGGSGGSVLIQAGTITGTGSIAANGGGQHGGGGGRIAIYFDESELSPANISAAGGTYLSSDKNGTAGTIYLKQSLALAGDVIVDNGGGNSQQATLFRTDLPAWQSLTISGGASAEVFENLVHASGHIDVSGGSSLKYRDPVILEGLDLTLDNGTLSDADSIVLYSSQLFGEGTISADLVNTGSVNPGSSTGILAIDGKYTQDNSGILNLELGSPTEHDQLQINGPVRLAGVLNLRVAEGYNLNPGDTFDIVISDTIIGTFDAINGLEDSIEVSYLDGQVRVVYTVGAATVDDNAGISHLEVSNLSSSSATVSWVSQDTVDASIHYGPTTGLGHSALDTTVHRVHSITMAGLDPSTQYFYEVTYGDSVDNNNGAYYSFSTTPVGFGVPYLAHGQVQAFGCLAPRSLVMLTLGGGGNNSLPLTVLTAPDGTWYLNLGNLKNSTTMNPLAHSEGDSLFLKSIHRSGDFAEDTILVSGSSPQNLETQSIGLTCCSIRGDINSSDNVLLDISDLIYLVDYQFQGGAAPQCPAEADMNATCGTIDISDLVYLIDYMFLGGPPPVPCPE